MCDGKPIGRFGGSVGGDGQYGQQSYSYDANTGNLNSRSGDGEYVYVYGSKPHAVVKAGNNTYQYDANGNMTRRTIGSVVWTYEYDAENHLVETKENGQTENRYIYDGDGNRVARLDANNEGTIFIGNYFEARYPAEEEPTSLFFDCAPEGSYCTYLPIVGNTEVNELFTGKPGVSYYYSGNQRIAMRTGGEAYLLFGDHLGSSSVVMKANGELVEKAYYLPWGGERGDTSITSTDYGYTGQMKEGDIYYYGARWYDPTIGRFMQADTIVPLQVQGTQAFDRYAYVNNNPLRYTDPSGNHARDWNYAMTDGGWNHSSIYDGNKAASSIGKNYTQYPGTQCTTAVSSAVHYGGIPVSGVWFDSIDSPAWYQTQANFNYWTEHMKYGYFESSDLPAVYNTQDLSLRESIFESETLHNEINSISSRIQIGDLVYYMDPFSYSENGVSVYTHVAMIVDIQALNGNTVPFILEVSGPASDYYGNPTILPRSIYDTPNMHIQRIAIVFIGR